MEVINFTNTYGRKGLVSVMTTELIKGSISYKKLFHVAAPYFFMY